MCVWIVCADCVWIVWCVCVVYLCTCVCVLCICEQCVCVCVCMCVASVGVGCVCYVRQVCRVGIYMDSIASFTIETGGQKDHVMQSAGSMVM